MALLHFIDNIAPISENIRINEKYKVNILNIILRNDNHNCQTFASKALQKLKPSFNPIMIIITDNSRKTKKKIDIFSNCTKETLQSLKNN